MEPHETVSHRTILALAFAVASLLMAACDRGPKDARVTVRVASKPDLSEGAPVLVQGYQVGRVLAIDLGADGRSTDVKVKIDGKYRDRVFSPPDTYAVITRDKGVFGASRIEIRNGGDRPIEDGAVIQAHASTADAAIDSAAKAAKATAARAEAEARRAADILQDAATRVRERLGQETGAASGRLGEQSRAASAEAAALLSALSARLSDTTGTVALVEAQVDREVAGLLASLRRRLDEVSRTPEGQLFADRIARVVAGFDTATSAGLEGATAHLSQSLQGLGTVLEQELSTLTRDKAAAQIEAALKEIHFITGSLSQVLEGIAVDAVRGPQGS
jgi:ABC-type transporter Mla subunit MlaD